jgi:hypothetical protein
MTLKYYLQQHFFILVMSFTIFLDLIVNIRTRPNYLRQLLLVIALQQQADNMGPHIYILCRNLHSNNYFLFLQKNNYYFL